MPAAKPTIADIAQFLTGGDTAFTIEFGETHARDLNASAVSAARLIAARGFAGIVDLVPTFRSLTVHYDNRRSNAAGLIAAIGGLEVSDGRTAEDGAVFEIPVLYGGAAGPDLEAVAAQAGLDPGDAARLHCSVAYRVYMLGFLPGFAYLGDLPEKLRMPRLDKPRTRVQRGAIAIADAMTAIYPSPSPGGWRLIGQTPVHPFDAGTGTCLFAAGDVVRFRPVHAEEYREIERAVQTGGYRPVEGRR